MDVKSDTASRDSGVDALLTRVKERGFVTTGEIFAAFPGLEPETSDLAAIYAAISSRGVEVVDEIAEELEREDQRRAGSDSGPPHRAHASEPRRSGGVVTRPGAAPAKPPMSRLGTLASQRHAPTERARWAVSTRCACT
jgi:hypothetical protein